MDLREGRRGIEEKKGEKKGRKEGDESERDESERDEREEKERDEREEKGLKREAWNASPRVEL
ncbi:MAG: hypothetical protein Q9188_006976 [Gyalolechia gomerana]